jgi:hypothetical protein
MYPKELLELWLFLLLSNFSSVNELIFHYFLFKVNDWLERLVDEKGEDLYRLKAVISVNESTGRFVFQVKMI